MLFIAEEISILSQMFKHLCENHISDNVLLKELDKKSLSLFKNVWRFISEFCVLENMSTVCDIVEIFSENLKSHL